MKPKITDFVNCDHLLFSLSRISLIDVTINQWRDATLTHCLSVNWNKASIINHRYIQQRGGGISQGANEPKGEQTKGQIR